MRLISALILASTFALCSCDPDGYPTKEDLLGTWVEESPYSDTLIFNENRTLIRHIDGVTDTILYRPNGEEGIVTFYNPSNVAFGEYDYEVLSTSQNVLILVDYRTNASQNQDGIFRRK